MKILLWVLQVLLAVTFIFSGASKLFMPEADLVAQTPLPILLLRFIGLMEVLGAAGLVLPGLFRIRTELTPLAAAGLAIITFSATIITLALGGGSVALFPFVICLLCLFVAWKRWTMNETPANNTGLPSAV